MVMNCGTVPVLVPVASVSVALPWLLTGSHFQLSVTSSTLVFKEDPKLVVMMRDPLPGSPRMAFRIDSHQDKEAAESNLQEARSPLEGQLMNRLIG